MMKLISIIMQFLTMCWVQTFYVSINQYIWKLISRYLLLNGLENEFQDGHKLWRGIGHSASGSQIRVFSARKKYDCSSQIGTPCYKKIQFPKANRQESPDLNQVTIVNNSIINFWLIIIRQVEKDWWREVGDVLRKQIGMCNTLLDKVTFVSSGQHRWQ